LFLWRRDYGFQLITLKASYPIDRETIFCQLQSSDKGFKKVLDKHMEGGSNEEIQVAFSNRAFAWDCGVSPASSPNSTGRGNPTSQDLVGKPILDCRSLKQQPDPF